MRGESSSLAASIPFPESVSIEICFWNPIEMLMSIDRYPARLRFKGGKASIMNRILYFSLFGAIFLIALIFSLQNLDPVKVYFYRGIGKELAFEMPLALILALELLAGVVIGYSVQMFRYLQLKAENSRLKRQLQVSATESASNQ